MHLRLKPEDMSGTEAQPAPRRWDTGVLIG